MRYCKGPGLVSEAIDEDDLRNLPGSIALGHVLYESQKHNAGSAQPLLVTHKNSPMAVAFNGNITNVDRLRLKYQDQGGVFFTNSDAEIILHVVIAELNRSQNIEKAALGVMEILEGAFSILLLMPNCMIALRDPQGFRPLCMGKRDDAFFVSSESCAFDAVGAKLLRDVRPGEIVIIHSDRIKSFDSGIRPDNTALCAFEYIYFSRPDSYVDGSSVELFRQESGRCLARADKEPPGDIVVGVPDSGLSAALGYSKESGIPFGIGLVKNRYVGRSFIQSTQALRERSVNEKLFAQKTVLAGRRVVLVDDSIVRGTTITRIVRLLREAGVTEVHLRISSPPFAYPCYYGTDISSKDVLVAGYQTIEEMRVNIGLDSLKYLSQDDLLNCAGSQGVGICTGCFTGIYPLPIQKRKEGVV
jgi:amidophosphoribosyltransferase